ncbi:hypothetical protein ACJX0J_012404 [Zea mays]
MALFSNYVVSPIPSLGDDTTPVEEKAEKQRRREAKYLAKKLQEEEAAKAIATLVYQRQMKAIQKRWEVVSEFIGTSRSIGIYIVRPVIEVSIQAPNLTHLHFSLRGGERTG